MTTALKPDQIAEAMRRLLIEMDRKPEPEPIMQCGACGHRAPFYLMKPALTYPGTVRCPECLSDKTRAEVIA